MVSTFQGQQAGTPQGVRSYIDEISGEKNQFALFTKLCTLQARLSEIGVKNAALDDAVKKRNVKLEDYPKILSGVRAQVDKLIREGGWKAPPVAPSTQEPLKPQPGITTMRKTVTVDGERVDLNTAAAEYRTYSGHVDEAKKLEEEIAKMPAGDTRKAKEYELSARRFLLAKEEIFLAELQNRNNDQGFAIRHQMFLADQKSELNAVLTYMENGKDAANAAYNATKSVYESGALRDYVVSRDLSSVAGNGDEVVEATPIGRISLNPYDSRTNKGKFEYPSDFVSEVERYNRDVDAFNRRIETVLSGGSGGSALVKERNRLWQEQNDLAAKQGLYEFLSSEQVDLMSTPLGYAKYELQKAHIKAISSYTTYDQRNMTQVFHFEFYDGKKLSLYWDRPVDVKPDAHRPQRVRGVFSDPGSPDRKFEVNYAESMARWPTMNRPTVAYYRLNMKQRTENYGEIREAFYHNFDTKHYSYLMERKDENVGQSLWVFGDPRVSNTWFRDFRKHLGYFSQETGRKLESTYLTLQDSGIPVKVFQETSSAISQITESGQVRGFVTMSAALGTGQSRQAMVNADKGKMELGDYLFEITNIRQQGIENVADVTVYRKGVDAPVARIEGVSLVGQEGIYSFKDGEKDVSLKLKLEAPREIASRVSGVNIEYNGELFDLKMDEAKQVGPYFLKLVEVVSENGTPFARLQVYRDQAQVDSGTPESEDSISVGVPQSIAVGGGEYTITVRPLTVDVPAEQRFIDETTVVKWRNLYQQGLSRVEGEPGQREEQTRYRPGVVNLYVQKRWEDPYGKPVFFQSETIGLRVQNKENDVREKVIAEYMAYERPQFGMVSSHINVPTLTATSGDVWLKFDKNKYENVPIVPYGAGASGANFYRGGSYWVENPGELYSAASFNALKQIVIERDITFADIFADPELNRMQQLQNGGSVIVFDKNGMQYSVSLDAAGFHVSNAVTTYGNNQLERGQTTAGGDFIIDKIRSGNLKFFVNVAPWLSGSGVMTGMWGTTYRNDPANNEELIKSTSQMVSFRSDNRGKRGFNVNSLLLKTYSSNYAPEGSTLDKSIITRHEAEVQYRDTIQWMVGERYRRNVEPWERHSGIRVGERSISLEEGQQDGGAGFGSIRQEYYGSAAYGANYGQDKKLRFDIGLRARRIEQDRYRRVAQFEEGREFEGRPQSLRSVPIDRIERSTELGTNTRWKFTPRDAVTIDLTSRWGRRYEGAGRYFDRQRLNFRYEHDVPGQAAPLRNPAKVTFGTDLTRDRDSQREGKEEQTYIDRIYTRWGSSKWHIEVGQLGIKNFSFRHHYRGEYAELGIGYGASDMTLGVYRTGDNRSIRFNARFPLRYKP
jgi:hypothetical protein